MQVKAKAIPIAEIWPHGGVQTLRTTKNPARLRISEGKTVGALHQVYNVINKDEDAIQCNPIVVNLYSNINCHLHMTPKNMARFL